MTRVESRQYFRMKRCLFAESARGSQRLDIHEAKAGGRRLEARRSAPNYPAKRHALFTTHQNVFVKAHGEFPYMTSSQNPSLTRCQLTREEEEAMGEEKEVRKEDQDRINRFSRLHSREKLIEEDLKTKQASCHCN